MEEVREYELVEHKEAGITSLDSNPCYELSSKVRQESAFTTSQQVRSKSKKPIPYWICMCALVGFASAAFASLASITMWNISRVNHQSSEIFKLERMTTQLQISMNESVFKLERSIMEFQNSLSDQSEIQTNISGSLFSIVNNIIAQLNGRTSIYPANSCSHVLQLNPSSPSGHYWIRSSNGSAVRVYCDMTRSCGNITGGWIRVASLDWSNESLPCPDGFRERSDSNIRTCGIGSTSTGSCPSIIFETYSTVYSRVCGKINAYQVGNTDAFDTTYGRVSNTDIDSNYVDGVSLTHGSNPRRHIWTFVAAVNDDYQIPAPNSTCQCVRPGDRRIMAPPSFVGMDYFCDTGSQSGAQNGVFHSDDPLWDSAGCASTSTCCSFNNPPWFHKQLSSATTDDIEMRVCCDEGRDNEDIAVSNIEIFVQ